MYDVATHFNQPTWDQYGPNWLRTAKSEKLSGFIIGQELSEDAQDRIQQQFGFRYIPFEGKGRLEGISDHVVKPALLTKFNVLPKGNLSEDKDLVCSRDFTQLLDVVESVINLQKRAEIIKLIEEKVVNVYGGILSANYILGSIDFWKGFTGFQSYIKNQDLLENQWWRDELILNLYVSFFNYKIGIE